MTSFGHRLTMIADRHGNGPVGVTVKRSSATLLCGANLLLLCLCQWLAASPAAAQSWERISPPPRPETRQGAILVYDPVREHFVLFGGYGSDPLADTWTLAGDVWTRLEPSASPPARFNAYGFWYSTRDRMVVFGGSDYGGINRDELWTWNGSDWSSMMPAGVISPERRDAAVAYDSHRDRIVLFGGNVDGSPDVSLADTWEFDGTNWIQITPATSPPDRCNARMGYDPVRQIVVLMGGQSETEGLRSDTWTYDGTTWTQQLSADTPATSSALWMTWDPVEEKLMLAGEDDVYNLRAWHFDGTRWIAHTESNLIVHGINAPCLAFDQSRGYALYFTSENQTNLGFKVTPPGDWSQLLPTAQPGGIDAGRGGFVYDTQAGELRLFGDSLGSLGFAGWRWDGDMWRLLELQNSDEVSSPARVAYDSARNTTVVFNGLTFELVGDTWTRRTIAVSPPSGGAMAYHAGRSRVVYFGGVKEFLVYSNETWEWDGSDWQQLVTRTSPPARASNAMAYDAARGRLVLFGGMGIVSGQVRYLGDTWELVGGNWQEVGSSGPTTLRGVPSMTYDAKRQRIVMWAEQDMNDARAWEFDGTAWVGTDPPENQGDEGLVGYDPDTKRLLLHLTNGETWARDFGTSPNLDGGVDGDGKSSGCGCSTKGELPPTGILLLVLLVIAGLARKKPNPCSFWGRVN